jgi:FKBP-type peptidyl-prolyl cis-trans isomerase
MKQTKYMKPFIAGLLFCTLIISACGKKESGCQPVPVTSEKQQLVAYCQANSINYTEHASGLLYEIINPGSGASPTNSSVVSVVYTGMHFNNTAFDAQANPVTFSLASVIDGWKIGVPLIKKGGRIKLVIPSALAYSCTGSGSDIAPNEPLFFDVTLTDVK